MQFIRYMQEHYPDVEIVYPYEELMNAKEEYGGLPLYLEADTHWNPIGGFVGTRTLLEKISELTGAPYTAEHREFAYAGQGGGTDLATMGGLGSSYTSALYIPDVKDTFIVEAVPDRRTEDILRHTAISPDGNGGNGVNLYVVGDSFRHMMSQYFFEWAGKTTVVNRFYFDPDDMIAQHPNVVVYEMVDRHLGELSNLPGYNTSSLR